MVPKRLKFKIVNGDNVNLGKLVAKLDSGDPNDDVKFLFMKEGSPTLAPNSKAKLLLIKRCGQYISHPQYNFLYIQTHN